MADARVQELIRLFARLPGLGPRSARRAVLHLIQRHDGLMGALADSLGEVARDIAVCSDCGNVDVGDPCQLCRDPARATGTLCVVEQVSDLWALERTRAYDGRYHVLGGTLSAIDGVTPESLRIPKLVERAATEGISEVILALNATVDGQTTAHYVADRLAPLGLRLTRLARGVPIGGELDYMDDGTLSMALRSRSVVG